MDNLVYTWTHPRGITHDGSVWDLGILTTMDGGNYIIEAKMDQCYSLDTVNITVFPEPLLYISYEDTLCFGNPVVLDPKDTFAEYEWSTGSNMPTIIAYEAGIYWLKIIDINGCRAIDIVTLEPCLIEVLVPNAFTPNGDGLNDTFKPIFTGFEPGDYRMDIYSKWGQLLFTTSTLSEGWDGRVNGQLVYPDTFVYVISYEVPSYVMRVGLTSPITGRVSVIR
jgi:gliding motility-associated-like protein